MAKSLVFKTLIDVLYVLHFIGFLGIIFTLPFGTIKINQVEMNVEDWNLFHWSIFIVNLMTYMVFLRGLYFLRKMARHLLSKKYFSKNIIQSLKKSGNHFICSGIISFSLFVIIFIKNLTKERLHLIYDNNLFIPLFLITIGVFFILQSNALGLARNIQQENELTV